MHVIVAGCGRVGAQLAQLLSYEGHDVVVIDKDERAFARLVGGFNGVTMTGVAFDEELLREAGIERADALAAVTNYDNTNLMVAEIAGWLFGVPLVVARLYDPEKRRVFTRMGVNFICGTTLVAEAVMTKLLQGGLIVRQDRPDAGIRVMEFYVPRSAGAVKAGDFEDGLNSRILALEREGRQLRWDEETPLQAGDDTVVAVKKEGLKEFHELLEGIGLVRVGFPEKASRNERQPGHDGMKVVVAGCGRVGAQLAEMLSLDGYDVVIIDKDASAFGRLSKTYPGEAVQGLSFDIGTLKEAGIESAGAFAAVTNFDNTNLMTAEVAKRIFDVPRVVARIYNPDKKATYEALGLDYVVGTEHVAGSILETMLKPAVRRRAECCGNRMMLLEFDCPQRWAGQTVAWCERQAPVWVAYLVRDGKALLPDMEARLEEGDEITALVSARSLPRLERHLRNKGRR